MNPIVVGENIKQLRVSRGFSQSVLADFLKIDQSMISKIENGKRTLSADMLAKLSYLFGVPAGSLEKESIPEKTLSFAFRGNELTAGDMEAICAINKIALNIEDMNRWLKESSL